MEFHRIVLFAVLIATGTVAPAQEADPGTSEIIVTASRREAEDFDERVPAVGLKRVADFAIQRVRVTGDTRETATRHEEMYQTIRRAIELAGSHGVQLAFGETIVEPLTLANYRDLTFEGDSRPDTNQVSLMIKSSLSGGVDAREATARIDRFLKALKPIGRALVVESGDMTLSIVAPDQYRGDIGALVARDAAAMAGKFGADYAVEVRGLNRPVEWSRAGLTEVLLYIPYELVIVPKP